MTAPTQPTGQVVITAKDTERAQDLARRRGEMVPELVEALCSMVEFFGPYGHGSAENRRDALTNAHAVLGKVEALS